MSDFRTVLVALVPFLSGQALVDATDAVLAAVGPVPVGVNPQTNRYEYTHEALVTAALANQDIVDYMVANQKINAIKALRIQTTCGLKAAKDAVEDYRMTARVSDIEAERSLALLRDALTGDPWGVSSYNDDEPPF